MTDPVTKLYEGLTDRERGNLAFQYSLKNDILEKLRIESTMPEQNFIGLPIGYRRQISDMGSLSLLYAVEYWRRVSLCLALMGGVGTLLQDPDPEAYKPIMERFEAAEAILMALDGAYTEVCLDHGLDPDLMRFMAGHRFYAVATPDLIPDEKAWGEYRVIFNSGLNG